MVGVQRNIIADAVRDQVQGEFRQEYELDSCKIKELESDTPPANQYKNTIKN